jgi:hypothetical protein
VSFQFHHFTSFRLCCKSLRLQLVQNVIEFYLLQNFLQAPSAAS